MSIIFLYTLLPYKFKFCLFFVVWWNIWRILCSLLLIIITVFKRSADLSSFSQVILSTVFWVIFDSLNLLMLCVCCHLLPYDILSLHSPVFIWKSYPENVYPVCVIFDANKDICYWSAHDAESSKKFAQMLPLQCSWFSATILQLLQTAVGLNIECHLGCVQYFAGCMWVGMLHWYGML